MIAYYNEIDKFAANWLRELIKAGHIAPGVVDERSIEDVTPNDLSGFTQCHFFAGIGIWSHSLRLAGWTDNRPVWTASCPCQPFSAAGKNAGFDDERHLWPAFHHLLEQCRPPVVFGEQVASKAAEPWIDLVQADVEAMGYAFACVAFPSASVGAPHIRDRAYWVADSASKRWDGRQGSAKPTGRHGTEGSSYTFGMADTFMFERQGGAAGCDASRGRNQEPATSAGLHSDMRPGTTNGFWRHADWLGCRDGKWRPVEPALKQMVDGLACAMVYLRDARNDKEKTEEVKYAAAGDYRSEEILRAVRHGAAPEAVWLQIGRQIGFYEATLLFAFLLEYAGELGHFIDCAAQGGSEACSKVLREVRKNEALACPPHGRKYSQQRPEKFADALSELPQTGALDVIRTLNGSPLANGVTNRVGRLRGYGNAINAQAAKAFIECYLNA